MLWIKLRVNSKARISGIRAPAYLSANETTAASPVPGGMSKGCERKRHETHRAAPSPAIQRRTGLAHRKPNTRFAAALADRRSQRPSRMSLPGKPGLQRPNPPGHAWPGRYRRMPRSHDSRRHRQGHGGTGGQDWRPTRAAPAARARQPSRTSADAPRSEPMQSNAVTLHLMASTRH